MGSIKPVLHFLPGLGPAGELGPWSQENVNPIEKVERSSVWTEEDMASKIPYDVFTCFQFPV